jgi:hypothetical protein
MFGEDSDNGVIAIIPFCEMQRSPIVESEPVNGVKAKPRNGKSLESDDPSSSGSE